MFVVHNDLHADGKVAMVPIDFMRDLDTGWYDTLTGGKKQVPCMIIDGFVVGEAIPILKVLDYLFPGPSLTFEEASLIHRAQESKVQSDALLKHFGLCTMSAQARPYRHKGALQGEGLQWVKEQLKDMHQLLSEWEMILQKTRFLSGVTLGAVDFASAPMIGSLYHITEAPIHLFYPNCWRYYGDVKQLFMQRGDWPEISQTGCGFFQELDKVELLVQVFNCDRRAFACCGGREALSNPKYWEGLDDVEES